MAPAMSKTRASNQRRSATAPPRDRFPTFAADGDVKLVITGARQYQLHSGVLKNNSQVFRDLLDSVEPAPLTNKLVKNRAVVRYKLMLVENTDNDAEVNYIFEAVQLDANGRPVNGNPPGIGQDLEQGKIVPPEILAYHTVLGSFYNVPIDLGNAQSDGLSHLLQQALQVTAVAEYLECVRIITPPIESTLLATGQSVYRAISVKPYAWLAFAYRVRSKAIFKEALIHAAGQYQTADAQQAIDEVNLPEEVIHVLHTKGQFIKESVIKAERHLASYYPTVLMREATVGRVDKDNIGRANYANDIIMWIALSIFRHWLCDMMAADNAHTSEDMGYAFIKAIDQGGDKYLSKKLLQEEFHQRFPMSPKGMACVEHRLAEIKEVVKEWASPLMRSTAAVDTKLSPVPFFTNTNVLNSDFPWVRNGDAATYDDEYSDDDEDNGVPLPNDDSDDEMNDTLGIPPLSFGMSVDRSVDQLGPGDLESDTEEPEIEDDQEGRLAAANTIARLHRSEAAPVAPSLRRAATEDFCGDTEPETDQSYHEPYIQEARRRNAEREAVSNQGSPEAMEQWLDQDIERQRAGRPLTTAETNMYADRLNEAVMRVSSKSPSLDRGRRRKRD